MRERPSIFSFKEIGELVDQGKIDELLKLIRTSPAKAELTLSIAEYRALTNFQKCIYLHKKGGIKRQTLTRAAFDELTPGRKMKFVKEGGKVE
jgi:hypothetical protein